MADYKGQKQLPYRGTPHLRNNNLKLSWAAKKISTTIHTLSG